MTAHPESVVGRLRAAEAALQAELSIPGSIHRRAVTDCVDAKNRALRLRSPALLAALEKVWAACHEARSTHTDELSDRDDGIRAMANGTIAILAHLFESPEKTT